MLFRTQPTILLEIFCEFMINSQDIFKSIISPEDTCLGDLKALMGLTKTLYKSHLEVIFWEINYELSKNSSNVGWNLNQIICCTFTLQIA